MSRDWPLRKVDPPGCMTSVSSTVVVSPHAKPVLCEGISMGGCRSLSNLHRTTSGAIRATRMLEHTSGWAV